MMRNLVLAALVLIASGACADVTRFDPPDQRLDKKVTLKLNYAKLDDVAKSLTEQTGVTIKAGTGERDWKVREQHVTIHAKDVPLGVMLDQLAQLHSFHLSREGKQDEWTYIIWQDKKSRELEAEMVTAQKEASAQRAKNQRQASLDAAKKALSMTPEEARRLREKDPLAAYLGGTKSGRGFAQLMASLSPTDMELMLRGRRVCIPWESLPPSMQQAAMDTATGGLIAAERAQNKDAAQLKPLQLVFCPLPDEADELTSMGVGGGIALMGLGPDGQYGDMYDSALGPGMPMSLYLLSESDSDFGVGFGTALLALEEGASMQEVGEAMMKIMADEEIMLEASAQESPTEKTPPTDPKLTREVELKVSDVKGPVANDTAVVAISEAAGLGVMLESFRSSGEIPKYLKQGKQPLYKILVSLEKAGYTWDMDEPTLRIRPKDWAVQRSYVIPESLIVRYRGILEKEGWFTLDNLAALASELTDEQIRHSLSREPDLSYALFTIVRRNDGEREILRLYHSLSRAQKNQLPGETGLGFGDLTSKQWDIIAQIVSDRFAGAYLTDGSVRLESLNIPENGTTVSASFHVTGVMKEQQQTFKVVIMLPGKADLAKKIKARQDAREKTQQPAPPAAVASPEK